MTMAEGESMAANGYTLVIGDKNLSSWSLRPWLALKQCGISFATYGVDLARYGDDGTAASYAETLLVLPAMAEWTKGAQAETKSRTL